MCDLPKPWFYKSRGEQELDTAGMKSLIDDFARIGTMGLSFTGGEPTVRPDCFALLEHASSRGMLAHLNTNAYTLQSAEQVRALLDTGVESMNISLDSADPATHDRCGARSTASSGCARHRAGARPPAWLASHRSRTRSSSGRETIGKCSTSSPSLGRAASTR
jgi:MoaA/NifB/PqqE/SkfB family radical SAM enzyme